MRWFRRVAAFLTAPLFLLGCNARREPTSTRAPSESARIVAYLLADPPTPWGDYGSILWNGMSAHLPRVDGKLQIERTGPFVPAVTFPGLGTVVVRDALKKRLVASGLTGLSFRPVILARVVELHWENWDVNATHPAEYPEDGEPESYILDRPHAPRLAEEIGPMWELVPQGHAVMTMDSSRSNLQQVLDTLGAQGKRAGPRPPTTPPSLPFTLAVDAGAPDFFGAGTGAGFLFVSARAREWLEKAASGSLRFTPVSATPAR